MRFLPPRRWFQFRLSTWFVLVAILAWAMTCRPWHSLEMQMHGSPPGGSAPRGFRHEATIQFYGQSTPTWIWMRQAILVNPDLRWPTLALGAFLAWKAAGAFGPRHVRHWLQFHLSTWLVLVAIFAWAMAMPHYSVIVSKLASDFEPIESEQDFFPFWYDSKKKAYESHLGQRSKSHRDWDFYSTSPPSLNPRLAGPALALAAFLVWKAAWGVVERRLAHLARPTPLSHDR